VVASRAVGIWFGVLCGREVPEAFDVLPETAEDRVRLDQLNLGGPRELIGAAVGPAHHGHNVG
jgi:hypothetical protein